MEIELFYTPACNRCKQAKIILKKAVMDIADHTIQWREVNVIEELDYAVQLGILATPSIAIDGRLIFTSMPSIKKFQNELRSRLTTFNDPNPPK